MLVKLPNTPFKQGPPSTLRKVIGAGTPRNTLRDLAYPIARAKRNERPLPTTDGVILSPVAMPTRIRRLGEVTLSLVRQLCTVRMLLLTKCAR